MVSKCNVQALINFWIMGGNAIKDISRTIREKLYMDCVLDISILSMLNFLNYIITLWFCENITYFWKKISISG